MNFVQEHLAGRVDLLQFYRDEGVVFHGKRALCPFHDDTSPSFDVVAETGVFLCRSCGAGGDPVTFLEKRRGLDAGAAIAELRQRYGIASGNDRPPAAAAAEQVWLIRDAEGDVVAEHRRRDLGGGRKKFRWIREGRDGLGGLPSAALPLYGSERIRSWPPEAPIIVVEGEKAADALLSHDLHALGTVTGAPAAPAAAPLEILRGRHVVLWGDYDEPGRKQRDTIGGRLEGVADSILVLEWGEEPGDDAHDFFARGGTEGQLDQMLADAPEWRQHAAAQASEIASPPSDWIRPGEGLAARPVPMARVSLSSVLPTLHRMTREGLPTGGTIGILGGPDTGKTGLAMTIADAAERQGFVVVHTTDDNGLEAAEIRWGQMMGFDRTKLEGGDPGEIARFKAAFAARDIFMPDPDECDDDFRPVNTLSHIIEEGKRRYPARRVFLLIDSVQAVIPDRSDYDGPRLQVNQTMRLFRKAANIPGWAALATSQTNRGARKFKNESKNTTELTAGAESGAIEYGFDLMLTLSAKEEEAGTIRAKITKNKPGSGRKGVFPLIWDRERARASEPDAATFEDEARTIARQAKEELCAEILAIIAKEPGISTLGVEKQAGRRKADCGLALRSMRDEDPPRVRMASRGAGKYWYLADQAPVQQEIA